VSNFIIQSLQNKDLTIYGDGSQTRSFQYVSDLVEGLVKLMDSEYTGPVNLGNPDEHSILDFAVKIKEMTGSQSSIIHLPPVTDDPMQRCPDIGTAKKELNWKPVVDVADGLRKTIDYFQAEIDYVGEIQPTGPYAAKPRGKLDCSAHST
jgi:UDP-glucuronate decarboxylase